MEEQTIVSLNKIWGAVVGVVVVTLILTIAAYNITDRIELGHVGYTQTLTPTK